MEMMYPLRICAPFFTFIVSHLLLIYVIVDVLAITTYFCHDFRQAFTSVAILFILQNVLSDILEDFDKQTLEFARNMRKLFYL